MNNNFMGAGGNQAVQSGIHSGVVAIGQKTAYGFVGGGAGVGSGLGSFALLYSIGQSTHPGDSSERRRTFAV